MQISETTGKDFIAYIEAESAKGTIGTAKAQILIDLLKQNKNVTLGEAVCIVMLSMSYKVAGFYFDKRLSKSYFKSASFQKEINSKASKLESCICHTLYVGENFHALENMLDQGVLVDIIYIDPPYGKDSMGSCADTNYDNALTRDNLLSELFSRLLVAKLMLDDSGVIFCSIDNRNEAYLKCLMDDIFGEDNCIDVFIWESNSKPDNSSEQKRPNSEFVLCYAKNKSKCKITPPKCSILDRSEAGTYQKANAELKAHFGKKRIFNNPKPTSLMSHLISMIPNKKAVVLDFYAGSGSTGEAVIQLNSQDGGKRRFILCTNNEISTTTGGGVADTITIPRLNKALERVRLFDSLEIIRITEHDTIKNPTAQEIPYDYQGLVDDLYRRVEKKALENENAVFCASLIKKAESYEKASALAALGSMYKRTGLLLRNLQTEYTDTIHYLSPVKEVRGDTHCTIIKGDSLHALQNLLISSRGYFDILYIDFCAEEMDAHNLEKWKLLLDRATHLLSPSGIVFCSARPKQEAKFKCILDEKFEERNYIETFSWKDNQNDLAECLLCYAKDLSRTPRFYGDIIKESERGMASLSKSKEKNKVVVFPSNSVLTNLPDGKYNKQGSEVLAKGCWQLLEDVEIKNGRVLTELKLKGPSIWAGSRKIEEEIAAGTLIQIKSEKWIPYYKKLGDAQLPPTSILPNQTISSRNDVLKFMINITKNNDAKILHLNAKDVAISECIIALNMIDGGKRKCCICGNVNVDGSKQKIAMYEIKSVASFEQQDNVNAFAVIDERLYGLPAFDIFCEKAQWVCENFLLTTQSEKK